MLENGGEAQGHNEISNEPSKWFTFLKSDVDYYHPIVPKPSLNNRNIFVNAGKTLGGSSSINGIISYFFIYFLFFIFIYFYFFIYLFLFFIF